MRPEASFSRQYFNTFIALNKVAAASSPLPTARLGQDLGAIGFAGALACLLARAQIRSFESGVRAAEIALEGVRQENEVGARTILDILDAEQELLDAQVDLVRSQRDETVTGFAVRAAIGRLTARDQNRSAELDDPQKDYDAVRNSWFGLSAPGAVQ